MEHNGSADEHENDLQAEDAEERKSEVSEVVCETVEAAVGVEITGDPREEESNAEKVSEPTADKVEHSEHLSGAGVELSAGSEQAPTCQEEPKQRRGPKNHPGQVEARDLEIAALTKKLSQAKKANAELHTQLQRFHANEVVLQLENRLKEKQKRIDELVRETRTLKNSERMLMKEMEDIQNSKDDFPSKKRALQEELRVCKERIKQLKELYRAADEKGFKLHQQSFDLTVKNKGLSEKVRLLESASASSSLLSPALSSNRIGTGASIEGTSTEEVQTIISSQEEEITRLHQRVALMKKTHKAEQSKYERLLKSSQDEIERAQAEMEEFYQQLFAKERVARVQFLHMKKLKHALHELALTQQTNQRFQPFLANREMRIANRSNGSQHNQAGPHSPSKGPVLNPGRWIHEALHHLGFVMPLSSEETESTESPTNNTQDDQTNIPSNCIQGKLVPFPPPSTVGLAAATASTRALPFNRSTSCPQSGGSTRNDNKESDASAEEPSDEDDHYNASITARETALYTPENPDSGLDREK
ncbi:uncharacterized protein KRP23_7700 [Phytophthora ramorum]|uniref:uncharacterized protein n=1 Tax=Phytophthora ramorum TaxID=164328 RepID=UPI003096596C|nr:hypothetical protein KRP23_7700 [Phytophthora ramorum]